MSLDNFTPAELRIGKGVAQVNSLPFEAPWLNPFGACLIMITDIRRNDDGVVQFQLGDKNAVPYNNGTAWAKAGDFFSEWPD